MRINELFAEKVRIDGKFLVNQPALVLFKKDGTKVTYSWFEYKEKALWAMRGLEECKIKPGQSVGIIALNLPESFFAILGTILIGAIPVPLNYMLLKEAGQKELKKIIGDCNPPLVIGNQCLKSLMPSYCIPIEQIISEGKAGLAGRPAGKNVNPEPRRIDIPLAVRQPEEILIMPYTSGTNGQPKGVMLSEDAIIDRVSAIMNELKIGNQERIFSHAPLGHIAPLIADFFGQIYSGYTIYFSEHIEDRINDREKFKKVFPKILQQVQPTIFLDPPLVWENFHIDIQKKLKKKPFLSTLRKCGWVNRSVIKTIKRKLGFPYTRIFISAAAEIRERELKFFQKIGIKIDDIYGQTETGGPIMINGRPIGNVKVWIDPQNKEITIEGVCVMLGYYRNPEATKKSPRERTYRTGDLGKEEKGAILYAGRIGRGFKLANGEEVDDQKVYEMENEIKKIEGIEEAIVCGEGKLHPIVLLFYNPNNWPFAKISSNVQQRIYQIGEGYWKIKKFILLDKKELILTPTLKVKTKAVIERFKNLIDQMTEVK